ncbi:MAG: DUF790 family protein, partial [Anaerolineales bacterium]|nr:DUF790 family protein [Anaerolineales bacterium]
MLPLELLRARTRKGRIEPVYADINPENLKFADTLLELFRRHVEKRKKELQARVAAYETAGSDYRLVRGLSVLLQRLCSFQVEAAVDPSLARRCVFEEASRRGLVVTKKQRQQIVQAVATRLNVTAEQLDQSLYADLDDELALKAFTPISAPDLLKCYNLSLTQTLLFRVTFLEVTVSDHWKEVLRAIKFRGLMYAAETRDGVFQITVEGPLSLFKLTQRYGTSIAKVLPAIVQADQWEINGSVVRTSPSGKRLYKLRLTSAAVGDCIKPTPLTEDHGEPAFDSVVEEKFYTDFLALDSGWTITREPAPLIVGRHVFIPDFCFEKRGMKVYMEIVGFWTQKYLETKIKKLQQLHGVDLIIAANEQLACDKLKRIKGQVTFYKEKVPLRPIWKVLKAREETQLRREIQGLDLRRLQLEGDVIEVRTLAGKLGVSEKALRTKLDEIAVEGYTLAGEQIVSNEKLREIEEKLASMVDPSLSQTIRLLHDEGIGKPYGILAALN